MELEPRRQPTRLERFPFHEDERHRGFAPLDAGNGLRVLSDGSQHVRSWVDGDRVRLLVADYANEGLPLFFSEYVTPPRPLQAGISS